VHGIRGNLEPETHRCVFKAPPLRNEQPASERPLRSRLRFVARRLQPGGILGDVTLSLERSGPMRRGRTRGRKPARGFGGRPLVKRPNSQGWRLPMKVQPG